MERGKHRQALGHAHGTRRGGIYPTGIGTDAPQTGKPAAGTHPHAAGGDATDHARGGHDVRGNGLSNVCRALRGTQKGTAAPLNRLPYQHREIGDIDDDEDGSHPTVDAAEEYGKYPQQERTTHKQEGIEGLDVSNEHWTDSGGRAQDEENIKDIRANDIADGHVYLATAGCHYACGQFGHTGAGGKDGEADNGFADSQLQGDVRCRIHQDMPPDDQQRNAQDYLEPDDPSRSVFRHKDFSPSTAAGQPEVVGHVEEEKDEEYASVEPRKLVLRPVPQPGIEAQQTARYGHEEYQGNVHPNRTATDGNRGKEGRGTEYAQGIEDVRTHDVAHRHVAAALQRGKEADHKLGHARTESYHRETYHSLIDTELTCKRRRTVHHRIGTLQDEPDAQNHAQYIEYHIP